MSELLSVNCKGASSGVASYSIYFEDSFAKILDALKALELPEQVSFCIISDSNVTPLYRDEVQSLLEACGHNVISYSFQAGEQQKNLSTAEQLYEFLTEHHFGRRDILIALGGGVTGDLTGFVAATYMRGISFIQLPTTLLSQVDSSIGGKTGVDYKQYKNMVGAFKMPLLVYINTSVLSTLPEREFASGMAEVLKTALIRDAVFYEWLISYFNEIVERESEVLTEMIFRTCSIKKMIVEKDPLERGERAILNFGHTIGHALEKHMDFSLTHGECVALGCIAAAFASWKKGLLSMDEYYEIRDMFVPFNLPISIDQIDPDEVIRLTASDKKMEDGALKFICLKKIGKAVIRTDLSEQELLDAVNEIYFKEEDFND